MSEPIAELEQLTQAAAEDRIQSNWPADMIAIVGKNIYQGMNCHTAWREIPRGSVVGLIDTVRTRLLNFALEIEAEAPDAGEADPRHSPIASDRVSQVFHTTIMGNVTNLAQAGRDVAQVHVENITQGDMVSLKQFLTALGLQPQDISDLETALHADTRSDNAKEIGPQTSTWIGKIISKASSGALAVGSSVAASMIAKAIAAYLGLPQ